MPVHCFLFLGEQVDQQGGQASRAEMVGYETIARAVPAAARAVREQHHAPGPRGIPKLPSKVTRPTSTRTCSSRSLVGVALSITKPWVGVAGLSSFLR